MSESVLTESELAELEGLRARNKRGMVEPGSEHARRMEFLLRLVETGVREEWAARRWTCQETCNFYGLKERWWRLVRGIGDESGIPVPWEDPEKFAEWFEVMKTKGFRRHGAPPEVLRKAEEAKLARLGAGAKPAGVVVAPVVAPHLPMPEGKSRSSKEIVEDMERQVSALTAYHAQFLDRQDLVEAARVAAELRVAREDLRKWRLSMEKMREGDEGHEAEIRRNMGRVAAALGRALLRGLVRELGPASKLQVEKAWDVVAADLPGLLAEELGLEGPGVAAGTEFHLTGT